MTNKINEYKTLTHTQRSIYKKNSKNKIKNQKNKNNLFLDINNNIIYNSNNKINTNSTEYITKNNKTESTDNNYLIKNNNKNINITTESSKFNTRNFEINTINTLKKDIEIWKIKLVSLVRKYKETIPENKIYSSLIEIIDALKKDKTNKCLGDIVDENLINNMITLPVQNKQFRNIFLELLFRNKNIFDAVRRGQNNDLDKYFLRNIFGAEKIKK